MQAMRPFRAKVFLGNNFSLCAVWRVRAYPCDEELGTAVIVYCGCEMVRKLHSGQFRLCLCDLTAKSKSLFSFIQLR